MGDVQPHRPVMLIVAIVSRYDEAFDWALQRLVSKWGALEFKSPRFEFTETTYYNKSMGPELRKQFLAFRQLIDPASIAAAKLISNELEAQYCTMADVPEERPLNIDPGYISEAKLVLATTKNRDHRVYLQQGIFAEVTLHFHNREWASSKWTYPDYQRADFQAFFTQCRLRLRQMYGKQP